MILVWEKDLQRPLSFLFILNKEGRFSNFTVPFLYTCFIEITFCLKPFIHDFIISMFHEPLIFFTSLILTTPLLVLSEEPPPSQTRTGTLYRPLNCPPRPAPSSSLSPTYQRPNVPTRYRPKTTKRPVKS